MDDLGVLGIYTVEVIHAPGKPNIRKALKVFPVTAHAVHACPPSLADG